MAPGKTHLIIPIESQVRELDAKLLLACVAAERGYSAVIGSRGLLNHRMADLPPGVFLAKGMRSIAKRMFKILRGLGHEIVAWDEEALVRFPPEDHYRRRLSAKAVALVSHLFAWGEDDAQVFRDFPDLGGTPVHVTGNPRIDLLRPELRGYFQPEVDAIAREYGEPILINTNFGFVNSFASSLNLLQESPEPGGESVLGANTKGMEPEFARALAEHKSDLFGHFRQLVPAIADALPDRMIVVRPHPSEDHAPWQEAAGSRANVRVVSERSVAPWLLASRLLIHNGCTTAVEASVLGMPTVAFRPALRKRCDFELPNSLSHEVYDLEDLLSVVAAIAAGDLQPQDRGMRRALIERHIAALDGPLAADRMVDVLSRAGYADKQFKRPFYPRYRKARHDLAARTRDKLEAARVPGDRSTQAYQRHRFPGTSVNDLHARIRRLGEQLGRFQQVRAHVVSDHIFRIEADPRVLL